MDSFFTGSTRSFHFEFFLKEPRDMDIHYSELFHNVLDIKVDVAKNFSQTLPEEIF